MGIAQASLLPSGYIHIKVMSEPQQHPLQAIHIKC